MTKTPDEIKKGLACCAEPIYQCADDCPYKEQCRNEQGGKAMNENALALIQQLQAENAEKADRIKKLEAERDAAVADILYAASVYLGECNTCKNGEVCAACKRQDACDECPNSKCMCSGCSAGRSNWQWRGVQKEATP